MTGSSMGSVVSGSSGQAGEAERGEALGSGGPDSVRALAVHLPQFHPIPENDAWWGKGFTEWRNVTKAKPLFDWHEQPHLPADLGFYDLRVPEVRSEQAALARRYGISGFMYYHYWFTGKPLLERPVQEIVSSGEPEFPFCVCWANENWTRAWDGMDREVLLDQRYSAEDDLAHLRYLIPILSDPRYIRIEGKPLLAVYRPDLLPEPKATAERWRKEAESAGLGGLFLLGAEGHEGNYGDAEELFGFDARYQFPPAWRSRSGNGGQSRLRSGWRSRMAMRLGLMNRAYGQNRVLSYELYAKACMSAEEAGYPRFPGVMAGFDNACRRVGKVATVYRGSTPELYRQWLERAIEQASDLPEGQRWVVVNAWNEWAEGNHLEPDQRYGHAYLEATRDALVAGGVFGGGAGDL